MRNAMFSLAAPLALGLLVPVAQAEDWKPARLWVAGSDESAWVIGAGEVAGKSLPQVQLWYGGLGGPAGEAPRLELPPVSGEPLLVGADREALRVLFSNLTAYDYFPRRPAAIGALWKEVCRGKPLAWAGDSAAPVFWALVRRDDLAAPTTGAAAAEASKRIRSLRGDLALLELRNGRWSIQPASPEASGGEGFWLAGRKPWLLLFWKEQGRVKVASRKGEAWSEPTIVLDEGIRVAWAGATPDGGVFVAGRFASDGLVNLRLLVEREGKWTSLGDVRDGTELLGLDPAVCGVGVVRGLLGVARPTASGGAEFGQAPLETSPLVRFTALATHRESPSPRSRWEEAFTLALLMGIMMAALWTRREEVSREIPLPAGYGLASVWRRIFATFLDVAPAVLIAAPWWFPKFSAGMEEFGTDITSQQLERLDAQLRAERIMMILLYGLWCYLWEVVIATTPGKLLFGCRVIGVDGSKPTPKQCLLRNLARVVMVSLGPSGLLVTLMTILVVTRNRQRIGDLLARTIVVEQALLLEEGPSGDDRPFGPSNG